MKRIRSNEFICHSMLTLNETFRWTCSAICFCWRAMIISMALNQINNGMLYTTDNTFHWLVLVWFKCEFNEKKNNFFLLCIILLIAICVQVFGYQEQRDTFRYVQGVQWIILTIQFWGYLFYLIAVDIILCMCMYDYKSNWANRNYTLRMMIFSSYFSLFIRIWLQSPFHSRVFKLYNSLDAIDSVSIFKYRNCN